MSIKNEIDRIKSAKTAISEKIAAKGVTVPSGVKIDDLPALVESIPEATAPKLQEKTANPSTSSQSITADSGYDGLSKVTVNAVQTEEKTATPSTSSQTITPTSGKFLSKVTVGAMPTATQATPSITVDTNGKITASATQTEGYVASGTKSATKQLTTQAAKTVTPSTSSQTAVASGRYTTGAVKVAAVPTQTKTATPSSSSQTITPDSGKFLSQVTVSGDGNLIPENIKSGVSIFGVSGTHQGGATIQTVAKLTITDNTVSGGHGEFTGGGLLGYYAFCYENGQFTQKRQNVPGTITDLNITGYDTFTIRNIVAGSLVKIPWFYGFVNDFYMMGGYPNAVSIQTSENVELVNDTCTDILAYVYGSGSETITVQYTEV